MMTGCAAGCVCHDPWTRVCHDPWTHALQEDNLEYGSQQIDQLHCTCQTLAKIS